jgi:hypothetical protein
VQQAILTACNTLGAAAQTLGVDITPLVTGCQLVVGGEGSFLLQLFLQSPSLGCAVMAGVPIVNNPLLSSACVVFAAALQPYSSMIAGLIPQALFDAV